MRKLADGGRIRRFMVAFGAEAPAETRVYFTGGATAVLHGWRESTIDVDIRFDPEHDALFRAIPLLKEQLRINVELASPDHFIPVRAGWEERSPFIMREGRVSFHHFDLNAQALSKIERGHSQDVHDVQEMLRRGLVDRDGLLMYFEEIERRCSTDVPATEAPPAMSTTAGDNTGRNSTTSESVEPVGK